MKYNIKWYDENDNQLGETKVDVEGGYDDAVRLTNYTLLRYEHYHHIRVNEDGESDPVNFDEEYDRWEEVIHSTPVSGMPAHEIVKWIRSTLKYVFGKDIKFSVTRDGRGSGTDCINVYLMSAPYEVCMNESDHYMQTNHYYPKNEYRLTARGRALMELVYTIALYYRWDKSDPMVDYFCTNYWLHTGVGKWDKPFEIRK